ncbi:MAG: MaoC family dehydratase N-terminal domain-containing protein [Desulfotignum sp.]|nr:MaoC family dehydratase N-terminal domain-containing protein [Desulfotignum sp.]MCF8125527.1 MaoC family dehydratase N-terminal domain-containing protein [Desulfotignum sp.]
MGNPVREHVVKGLQPGDTFCFTRRFSQEETRAFGDLTRDYNPVHYDRRWTRAKGFNDLICHGLLVGGMICEFGGQVGWLATGMNFKFLGPVYFGDTIQCQVTLTQIEKNGRAGAKAVFTNQAGRRVALATMTGRLPLDDEKNLLDRMISEGDPTNKLSTHSDYRITPAKK